MSDTSSGDQFADSWVPVPLISKTYDPAAKLFAIEFYAPKRLLLIDPQFEAKVHDELLRHAHRDGLVIEGQVMVTNRDPDDGGEAEKLEQRDQTVREVLANPELEAKVAADQAELDGEIEEDAVESPFRLSRADNDFRRAMRDRMRETAEQIFGLTAGQLDGRPLPGGHEFKLDRAEFLKGFFGVGEGQHPKSKLPDDAMVVRAEALVQTNLGTTYPDEPGEPETVAGVRELGAWTPPKPDPPLPDPDDVEIPDYPPDWE